MRYLPWMVAVMAAGMVLSARAQLTLNAGESWVHRFITLAPAGSGSVGGGFVAGGEVHVNLDPSTVQAGDALRCEMFEADTNQPPVCTTLVSNASVGSCSATGAWQDRRGAVRFSVVSGSVTINSFTLQASTFFPPSFAYFYSTTVVPPAEPRYALAIRREGGSVKLSWPAVAETYVLQTSPVIVGGSWADVQGTPVFESGQLVVTRDATGPAAFFRLIKR